MIADQLAERELAALLEEERREMVRHQPPFHPHVPHHGTKTLPTMRGYRTAVQRCGSAVDPMSAQEKARVTQQAERLKQEEAEAAAKKRAAAAALMKQVIDP